MVAVNSVTMLPGCVTAFDIGIPPWVVGSLVFNASAGQAEVACLTGACLARLPAQSPCSLLATLPAAARSGSGSTTCTRKH